MTAAIEFWYEFGSTYTYLTVARLRAVAAREGVKVTWRPFLLMPLMISQGMARGPFLPYPQKLDYMWRDLERRAQEHGVPYRRPSKYPPDDVLTSARVALLAGQEGWCEEFTEHVFRLHWTEDRLIGTDDNLRTAITLVKRDSAAVLEGARSIAIKEGLRQQTARAQELGLFGSPSFVAGGEIFWGDDRLEQALRWASKHR